MHVCDVVLLCLHLRNMDSSILKKNCCKWDLSKDRNDSINAKSPNVMSISTYRSRSVSLLTSNVIVSGCWWDTKVNFSLQGCPRLNFLVVSQVLVNTGC